MIVPIRYDIMQTKIIIYFSGKIGVIFKMDLPNYFSDHHQINFSLFKKAAIPRLQSSVPLARAFISAA